MFRRALSIDPALVEARIRLGRLLVERRRHDEAARELATALAANPPRVLAFYAHLFSGRAAQALGRLDAAAGHYREAVALFPGAQSARLAQSQAALLAADISGALAAIEGMKKPGGAPPVDDPWWEYPFGAGRDADALVRATWARLPQGSGLQIDPAQVPGLAVKAREVVRLALLEVVRPRARRKARGRGV